MDTKPKPGEGKTCLVSHPSGRHLAILRYLLEEELGFTFIVAGDSTDLVALFSEHEPALVVVSDDLRPENGYTTISRTRLLPGGKITKIIGLVYTNAEPGRTKELTSVGADKVIVGLNRERLGEALQELGFIS